MADRCPCLVPGCRRTIARGTLREWLCPRHWSTVPADYRRAYKRAQRRQRLPVEAFDRLWSRCRRAALEAAQDDLFGPGAHG